MQEQHRLNADQRELERGLRSVAPAAVRVDPVSAAFAAGRASGRRQVRFWRAAAAIVLTTGIAIHFMPAGHTAVETSHDSPGTVLVIQQQSGPPALPDESLLMLQRAIEDRGAEGLPAPRLCPVESLHAGDVL